MLKMRKGSAVPHPEKLYPSYQVMGKLFPDNPEEARQIISANIDHKIKIIESKSPHLPKTEGADAFLPESDKLPLQYEVGVFIIPL